MKKHRLLILSLAAIVPGAAYATTGFVTPTEMTITFTSLALIKADNSQITLMSGSFPTTFRKSDADFTAVSLAGITAPAGRFAGVQVCYNTDRSVKLSGERYDGSPNGSITNGGAIWTTTAASAITAGSVVTTAPGGGAVTLSGYVVGNGTNNCSSSYFASIACVSDSSSHCSAGDNFVNVGTTVPDLNILLDMYHAVGVDAMNSTLDNHIPVYPYPTIGRPGAAIHLGGNATTTFGDISLLFGADKKLLYSASYSSGGLPGVCTGNGFVSVSGGPPGSFVNSYGPTAVQTLDPTTGIVQFAAGNAGNTNNSVSSGMVTTGNVLKPFTTSVAVSCAADSAANPPYLGYTYTSGAGLGLASTGYTIKRIIDPTGVFAATTNCTGTCGTY